MELQRFVQRLGDSRGPAANPVVGHANPGGMPDDAARIEHGAFDRPRRVRKSGMDHKRCWTKC